MGFYLPLILIIVISLCLLFFHSRIAKKRGLADKRLRHIEAQLKRRFDLIPGLIKALRGAEGVGSDVLAELASARKMYVYADGIEGELAANRAVSAALEKIAMTAGIGRQETVAGAASGCADERIQNLWIESVKTEESIVFSLEFYNAAADVYNGSIEGLPGSVIAAIFQFLPQKKLQ